jgi:hypothetical protein
VTEQPWSGSAIGEPDRRWHAPRIRNNLMCTCGNTFTQISYLRAHADFYNQRNIDAANERDNVAIDAAIYNSHEHPVHHEVYTRQTEVTPSMPYLGKCKCGAKFEGKNPWWPKSKLDEHIAPFKAAHTKARVKWAAEHLERVNAALFNTTPEIDRWMEAKRQKLILGTLQLQLDKARAKGSAKTLVPLDTLQLLLDHLAAENTRSDDYRDDIEPEVA